jgi:hypothetical protein
MKFSRFDRHELFEMSDTSFVLDCIMKSKLSDKRDNKLLNMLYGLFDGYLYDEIYTYAYKHLPIEMYSELEERLNKVHLSLAI